MRKLIIVIILFLPGILAQAQLKRRVLFLGNSYTYVNNLPQLIADIALSKADTLVFDQIVPGGYTFQNHWNNPATYAKIKAGKWDAVVIQGQSQEPSFSPAQVMTDSYPYAARVADSVRKYDPCTELIFYMTWGRKNGDASNCAAYPPICTFNGMNARLRETYLMFADSFNASCAPVGVAWKKFRTQYPLVDLYHPDESHPSMEGSYLTACVFYSSIFKKNVSGAGYYSTVNALVAQNMQAIAGPTVMDSTEVWNLNSHLPLADFTYSMISGNNFQFINQSVNANTYNWSFGSTLVSPQHQFTGGTTVTVTLTAQNSCTTSSISKSLTLITAVEKERNCEPRIYCYEDQLRMTSCAAPQKTEIFLFEVSGKLLEYYNVNEFTSAIDISFLPSGVYFVRYLNSAGDKRLKIFK